MKTPNSKRNLDMAIRRMGVTDEDYIRMRAMLANAIVAQMMPEGAVKGGSALKIRFGDDCTRATTDLDAAGKGSLTAFVSDFGERLANGWNGFTARLVPREPASPESVPAAYVMQPFDVKLDYLKGAWCTVVFELGHNEIGDADEPEMVYPAEANRMLETMGFPDLEPIPLMPLHHQIAQKLHAVSEPSSMRAHDLIDLQLMVDDGDVDYHLTKQTCEKLFAYRKMQPWPPMIQMADTWGPLYDEQAKNLAVLPTVDEAVFWANALIRMIDEIV